MSGILDKEHQPLKGDKLADHIASALALTPPDLSRTASYQLLRKLFRPVIYGAENIPDRPCLFIGNHSLFAIDTMVLWPAMQGELGIFARPMADKLFFNFDPVADWLTQRGLVMGNPEVCDALMKDGQHLLLYPGGAYEAVKPQSQRYTLQWKRRHGFLRMAARHGYTIVPVAMVGPDEFYDNLYEGYELPDTPLGVLLKKLGILTEHTRRDLLPPLPMGALSSLFPKLQRCLIGFGEPLDLSRYKGKRQPAQTQLATMREQLAQQIEQQIAELMVTRESLRQEDGLLRRILRA